MKNSPFWIIDAFVGKLQDRALRGNPAAVVLLAEFPPDSQLQELANEFNLSETAFLVPRGQQNFDLRWFTSEIEVDLCGHATLAAAFALQEAKQLSIGQTARFHTRSGLLTAKVESDTIELDFPAQPVTECAFPSSLGHALKLQSAPVLVCAQSEDDWLLRVERPTLESLSPDFKKLATFKARGIIVTAHTPGTEVDFYSRFFAPRVGIDEDPVTGSAHTKLAPFWAQRLNKTKLNAVQLSRRGGHLELELRGDRVAITGKCHLRAKGTLL